MKFYSVSFLSLSHILLHTQMFTVAEYFEAVINVTATQDPFFPEAMSPGVLG